MFSLKTHAVITGGLFATIVAMAAVGNVLHNRAGYPTPRRTGLPLR